MPVRRRLVMAATALLLVVGSVGAPTASAAPKAPRFDVTTNVDRVSGYGNRVFLRFRFLSTNANRQTGFARLVIPVRTWTKLNHLFSASWGPGLQRTDPMGDGYFTVQKGSCAVARLDTFMAGSTIAKQSIDVKFDCKLGKSFSILWYPIGKWWDMDGTLVSDEDWAFPIRTRFTRQDRWTDRRAPVVTVTASPVFIDLPNLWLEAPQQIVEAEQLTDPVLGTPTLLIVGTTQLFDVTRVSIKLGLSGPQRVDTGQLVTVLDADLLRVQQTIEVSSCVPGAGYDCASAPLGVVTIREPVPGTFGDPTGNVLPSQVAVIYGVTFAQNDASGFTDTEALCRAHGGSFNLSDGAIDGNYWDCVFPPGSNLAQTAAFAAAGEAGIAALTTSPKAHCPAFLIVNRTHSTYYARVTCKR